MKPLFTTDREGCGDRYLGTYLGCDLYVTDDRGAVLGPSLIVRYGNEGHDYDSQLACTFRDSLISGGHIGLPDGKSKPYREWIISDDHNKYCRVMLLGLVLIDAEKVAGESCHI